MNYVLIALLSVFLLGLGWFLGYSQAGKQFQIIENTNSLVEDTEEFLQESNDLLQIEKFQAFQAESDIRVLEYLAGKKYSLVEEEIVDRLGRYYKIANESILDGMALNSEKTLVHKISVLSKKMPFLKKSFNMKNELTPASAPKINGG